MSILDCVNQYQLTVKDITFWTPYWINEPGVRSGPYAGKGSPQEIRSETETIFETYLDPIHSGKEARYLLLRNGLGVECSGFIYHVIDKYLQAGGKSPLVEHLFVPKYDLKKAAAKDSWKQYKQFSAEEMDKLPDQVPMKQVCEWFHREGQYITNVERLTDEAVSSDIDLSDIRAGDFVKLKSWSVFPHLGVITEVSGDNVEYYSSDFDPVGPGGVTLHKTTIAGLRENIEHAGMNNKIYVPTGVCRLKVLA